MFTKVRKVEKVAIIPHVLIVNQAGRRRLLGAPETADRRRLPGGGQQSAEVVLQPARACCSAAPCRVERLSARRMPTHNLSEHGVGQQRPEVVLASELPASLRLKTGRGWLSGRLLGHLLQSKI